MNNKIINFFNSNINIIGGVESVTETLYAEFIKAGAEVRIHSLYSEKTIKQHLSGANIIHYSLTPPDDEIGTLRKIIRVLINGYRILSKTRFLTGNCIYQGFYIAIYRPFVASKRTNHIICEHNSHAAPSKLSKLARRLIYTSFPSTITVLSEADKTYFKSVGLKNVCKVYNPLPTSEIKTSKIGTKTLISIGRFTHQKRFDLMIRLCGKILEKHPDWRLIIQGDGEDKPIIEKELNSLKNKNQVIILPIGDPTPTYAHGSIFLMTSQFEGLPMTLLEASSHGIPAVAMNCSAGLSEVIEDGVNGFLTPMDSVESFIDKVSTLIEDEALLQRFGEAARRSSKKFNCGAIIKEWEKVIK